MSEITQELIIPRLHPESYYLDELVIKGLRLTADDYQIDPETGVIVDRSWQARSIQNEGQEALFPTDTVHFNLAYSNVRNSKGEEMHTGSDDVSVPVSDIHDIEDEELRSLLQDKYLQSKDKDSNRNTFIGVNATNGSVHAYGAPVRPLGVKFTIDGTIKDEDYPEYVRRKSEEKQAALDALPRRQIIVRRFTGWLK
jgi:hypothetical protein